MVINKENIDSINPSSDKKIRWISMQSLAGGMTLGAEAAFGCPPLCTIDFDGIDQANSSAYMNYMNNVRKVGLRELILNGNLLSMTQEFKTQEDKDFFDSINHDIDVVSAVPICSGLSMANANNSKKAGTSARGSDAIQNNNMIGILKFALEVIKPKAYIFENAPNFFSNSGKGIRDKLTEIGKENGYAVTYVKTNSKKHSNPQYRSRTFGIFWKGGKCPKLNYVNDLSTSIDDYLGEIAENSPYMTDDYQLFKDFDNNGFIKYMKDKFKDEWLNTLENENCCSIMTYLERMKFPEEVKPFLNKSELHDYEHAKMKKDIGLNYMDGSPLYYGKNKICTIFGRTIGRLIHPSGTRGYTLREALKFMGMPDDYEFPGDAMSHTDWVGQNVPVITSFDWHKQIRDFVEGKLEMTNEDLIMFNNESNIKIKESKEKLKSGFDIFKNK